MGIDCIGPLLRFLQTFCDKSFFQLLSLIGRSYRQCELEVARVDSNVDVRELYNFTLFFEAILDSAELDVCLPHFQMALVVADKSESYLLYY